MASLTDYKIAWERHNDDGTITAFVRFYEGDITTEAEPGGLVTRYRRVATVTRPRSDVEAFQTRLVDFQARGGGWVITLKAGQDLRDTLKRILARDGTRQPVLQQRV